MEIKKYKEFELYGGEVKVRFYPVSHRYDVDDGNTGSFKRVRGVTSYISILDKSPALVSWATELAGTYLLDLLDSGEVITAGHIAK